MPHAKSINLLSLAKSTEGSSQIKANTFVTKVVKTEFFELEKSIWIIVLSGKCIIDFESGDFRILKHGDSLELRKGSVIKYLPLEESLILSIDSDA